MFSKPGSSTDKIQSNVFSIPIKHSNNEENILTFSLSITYDSDEYFISNTIEGREIVKIILDNLNYIGIKAIFEQNDPPLPNELALFKYDQNNKYFYILKENYAKYLQSSYPSQEENDLNIITPLTQSTSENPINHTLIDSFPELPTFVLDNYLTTTTIDTYDDTTENILKEMLKVREETEVEKINNVTLPITNLLKDQVPAFRCMIHPPGLTPSQAVFYYFENNNLKFYFSHANPIHNLQSTAKKLNVMVKRQCPSFPAHESLFHYTAKSSNGALMKIYFITKEDYEKHLQKIYPIEMVTKPDDFPHGNHPICKLQMKSYPQPLSARKSWLVIKENEKNLENSFPPFLINPIPQTPTDPDSELLPISYYFPTLFPPLNETNNQLLTTPSADATEDEGILKRPLDDIVDYNPTKRLKDQ